MNHCNHRWTSYFLDIAERSARQSKDPSTKVGAVLERDRRILATGYNGFPPGVADTEARLNDRTIKLLLTVHAEENAILSCAANGVATAGATIWVTRPPCAGCMRKIITAGIVRVVTRVPDPAFAERWATDLIAGDEMAKEAGIEIVLVPMPKWDRAATEACK